MFSGEKSDQNEKRIQSPPHTQLQTRQSEGKWGHLCWFVVHPVYTIHTPIQLLRMHARPRSNIYLPLAYTNQQLITQWYKNIQIFIKGLSI